MNIGMVAKGCAGWCVASAAALATLFAAEPAGAATVTVGSSCSLVNAVASVNALSNIGGCTRSGGGGERISIPAGSYTVNQELILTRSVRITASLPGATIISSAPAGLSFNANSNPVPTLTIDNVTIKPNTSSSPIYCMITFGVNLTLNNVSIDTCGMGLIVGQNDFTNVVNINNSRIVNSGWNGIIANGVELRITGTTISDNHDSGLTYYGSGDGVAVDITGSTISGNGLTGIELNAGGSSPVVDHTFKITTSSIRSNGRGGVKYVGYPGQSLRIYRSLVADNVNSESGGGVSSEGQTFIYASTIANNSSDGEGGGVYHTGAEFYLWHATIVGNSSDGVGGGVRWTGSQGGVEYCIIAANSGATQGNTRSRDINFGGTSGFTKIYNLIGTINGFTGEFADPSNVKGTLASPVSPRVHGLASNGGPTQTMALMSTSAARDAIPTANYRTPFTTVVDQRGVARPLNGKYDMGAYER
jgi:hypothetical protein